MNTQIDRHCSPHLKRTLKMYPHNLTFYCRLSKASAGGLLHRLQLKWWVPKVPCGGDSEFSKLDITQTGSAFVLLIVGGFLSILVLFVEICYQKFK